MADAIRSEKLQDERRVLDLLQAAGDASFDYDDFETAYLQCKDVTLPHKKAAVSFWVGYVLYANAESFFSS